MPIWTRCKFSAVLTIFELIFFVLFIIFVDYDEEATPQPSNSTNNSEVNVYEKRENSISHYYPMFQDVHVMMYIGFGFLMTFLKKYSFSAVGVNMLIAAFVVQWHILMSGFLELHNGKILINIITLTTAEFSAAAVLISFGAVLGKLSPLQLILMAFVEIVVYSVNEYIGTTIFKAVDMGGSMFVHVFGAYFGLAVSRVLYNDDVTQSSKEGSVYHSDIFSMIGTIFLWLFWPSFNGALAEGDAQHRTVINTYLALAACCLVTFALSSLTNKESKFDMVHIQNATLAGGVAVGTSSDLMIHPWGAMLIGAVAAIVSVIGFKYVQPFLLSKCKLHDTCGVNNLHGMPGILGGIAGCVAAGIASLNQYGIRFHELIPIGRTTGLQAAYQILTLAVTICMAIVGGLVTGLILRLECLDQPKGESLFDDVTYWEVPDEEEVTTHVINRADEVDKKESRETANLFK